MTLHVLSLLVTAPLFAQSGDSVADTSSPRATLRSFIDASNEFHDRFTDQRYFDRVSPDAITVGMRILDCLDTSHLPSFSLEERAGEVAICIKEILDRSELPEWNDVPGEDEVAAAEAAGKVLVWRIPGTRLTIARIEEGPQKLEFLFTLGTVDRAVEYFHSVREQPYQTRDDVSRGFYRWYVSAPGHPILGYLLGWLPETFRYREWWGVAAWKIVGGGFALIITIALMVLCYWLQRRVVQRVRGKSIVRYCLTGIYPLIAVVIPLGYSHFCERHLTLRAEPLYAVAFFSSIVSLLAGGVAIFATNNRIAEAVISSPRSNPYGLNAQLTRIILKLASLVLATVLFLVGGQYLGIPIATLLASAGIGGLAFALGAQDTLKTLFGTVMLMADKPFRVGERIVVRDYDGVVEDIGLRSTRIRLLTGHQVTIPNDELSRSDIENVGRRPYIRRLANIHLPLDTPREKVDRAITIVRDTLANHDGMHEDLPPRVFFNEFNEDSFNICMYYWFHPADFWQFLEFSERLNLTIFQQFEEHGILFSLPERVTHTSIDGRERSIEVKVSPSGES